MVEFDYTKHGDLYEKEGEKNYKPDPDTRKLYRNVGKFIAIILLLIGFFIGYLVKSYL